MHSPNASTAVRFFILGSLDVRSAANASIEELINQPKRLAVLTYLALAPNGSGRRRDDLLALFWPESDELSARNSLNQTIRRLRGALGEQTIVTTELEIAIDRELLWCDAAALRLAASNGDDRQVLELYRGDLLQIHVRGAAPEFEMWLARERDELRALAIRSAWKTSEAETANENRVGAAHWARVAVSLAPADEEAAHRLVALLDAAGDRTGALRAYEDHAAALRGYELEPTSETAALAAAVRARVFPPAPLPDLGDRPPVTTPAPKVFWRTRAFAGGLATLVFLAVAFGFAFTRMRRSNGAVVAVGAITLESKSDSALPVAVLLSTSLSRIPGLTVITEDRVGEVRSQLKLAGVSASARRAAIEAGATFVVEGVLSNRGGKLRLDVRRVDRDAQTRGGHVVEGQTLYDVVDLATEQIAHDFGLSAPAGRLNATNASLVAYRLYELGLRAYHDGDNKTAERFFRAALAEDSTFAMAALYAARVIEGNEHFDFMKRARTLSANSPEHERLLIAAQAGLMLHEMNALPIAESLAVRYPHDPAAASAYSDELWRRGHFVDAAKWARHAANLDSLSIYSTERRCPACDGWNGAIIAYIFADSPVAAEREARALVARFPKAPRAWYVLGSALRRLEKFAASDSAFAKAPGTGAEEELLSNNALSDIGIRQQRFAEVDAAWEAQLKSPSAEERRSAYWGYFISLQSQGRRREALAAAQAYRRLTAQGGDEYPVLEAIALSSLGRYTEAAHIFEGEARKSAAARGPLDARVRAWNLTHAATAYAAAGDTARVRMLEDSVRFFGLRSSYARDQRLHYYVHGLRLQAQGQHAAARAAFEKAVYSLHEGYVRVPLELARASLDVGDAPRAIAVLKPALLGPMSASGLYASRTDLLQLLGDAYARNQQRDSAIAVYSRVLKSWERADREMLPRVESVRLRLAALGPIRPPRD